MTMSDLRDQLRNAGFPLSRRALLRLSAHTGPAVEVEELREGIVHRVSRVRGEDGTVILKRREKRCRRAPVTQRPEDIVFEKNALEVLGQLRGDVVPHVIGFDDQSSTLLLTDVSAEDVSDGTAVFEQAHVPSVTRAAGQVATVVADLHSKLAALGLDVVHSARRDGEVFERNLFERISSLSSTGTDRLCSRLRDLPRQTIIGDLSPKNMLIGRTRIALFDFEYVHNGVRAFDVGFFCGHVVLHQMDRTEPLVLGRLAEGVQATYEATMPLDAAGRAVVGAVAAATVAYRLANPFVAYRTKLDGAAAQSVRELALGLAGSDAPVGEIATALVSRLRTRP